MKYSEHGPVPGRCYQETYPADLGGPPCKRINTNPIPEDLNVTCRCLAVKTRWSVYVQLVRREFPRSGWDLEKVPFFAVP